MKEDVDCEPDYKSFMNVMSRTTEFAKLDKEDQRNLALYLNKSPKDLKKWIDNIVEDYGKRSIDINGKLLFIQVKAVWWPDPVLEENAPGNYEERKKS
jgi:hypothetical protein